MICSLTNHLPTSHHSLASWRCSWSPGSPTNRYGPWNCPESHIYMCVMCLATVRMFNKLLHSMMVCTKGLPHVGLRKRLLAWEKKRCEHPHQPQYHLQGHDKRSWSSWWYYALCLHPSAKKSLNAKTQTQSQKERLMSHPFYHLLVLIKHSSEWTLCWGPNSTSSDLYRKPVLFQKLTSSFSAAYRHVLSKTDYYVRWEYLGVCIYTQIYVYISIICMHGPLWSNIMQNLCNFHRNIAAWLAPALDGLQYRRQTLLKRVEGKVGQNVV